MLRQAHKIFPRLAIVTDVQSQVSDVYMRLKQRYGEDILIDVEVCRADPGRVLEEIRQLNQRQDVQAIIVQLPLADMSQVDGVLSLVDPAKDVDGLNSNSTFDAATPMAINWLLAGYGVELTGRKVALVGRGRLVGGPLERMWRNSGVDVVVFEEGDDLATLRDYSVIVSAAGVPGIIVSDMVQPGAVVVDAGTAVESGEIRGDVAEEVRQREDLTITPKRGGVGPLTVAALFDNVITACLRQAQH